VKQLPSAIAYSTLHYALTLWIVLVAPAGAPKLVAAYLDVFVLPLVWAPALLILRGGKTYDAIFSRRIREAMIRPEATPWEQLFTHELLDEEHWIRVTNKTDKTQILGGILAKGSYISRFPEARQLYVSQEWTFDEAGAFKEPVNGGILITIGDDDVVEILESNHGQPTDGAKHRG
jgi:hypothetical protein